MRQLNSDVVDEISRSVVRIQRIKELETTEVTDNTHRTPLGGSGRDGRVQGAVLNKRRKFQPTARESKS